ncbi:MAG: TetR/AcrR family transcriptional regulator, partial [Streptococcus gallolyticus]|nr:TetR/AcrR family transcriptional regulator [Streptococcus gallolyticus]
MTEKTISQKSLQNLQVSNKESQKLTRESLETALL